MASGAIITQGHVVYIGVASDTLHWRLIENHSGVTGSTIHFLMEAFQNEIRGIVTEHDRLRIRSDLPFCISRTSLMLQRTRNFFAPDQGGVGPTGRAVALFANYLPVH